MAKTDTALKRPGFGKTLRIDAWWLQPLAVFLGFSAFIVYATWSALQGAHYHWGPYLSPFYSPELFGESKHALFGGQPDWWPGSIPFSPAFLILWAPVVFRFTCYYYRGAYYKAFWADPANCAVGEPRQMYRSERFFPMVLQNVHRYTFIFAAALIVFLWIDAVKAFWFQNPDGSSGFGIGIGTIVLLVNVVLLSLYTFGCHSLRHLVGGKHDCLSKRPVSSACYNCVSGLNKKHMLYAWLSLTSVGLADLYVRLVSMGIWTDIRIL